LDCGAIEEEEEEEEEEEVSILKCSIFLCLAQQTWRNSKLTVKYATTLPTGPS
jgi:hypothetical protein